MPKVSLVLFLTIEDEANDIGLATPDRPLSVDLTVEQKRELLSIVADVLENASHEDEPAVGIGTLTPALHPDEL